QQGIDNVWFQRKWIVRHSGRLMYIASAPHSPDWANRLIRFAPHVQFKGEVHDRPVGVNRPAYASVDKLCFLHLDLLLNSRISREGKMKMYEAANPGSAYPWYELYEDYGYRLAKLGSAEARWLPDIAKIAVTDSTHSLALQRVKYWVTPRGFFH